MISRTHQGALALLLCSFALGPACNCNKAATNTSAGQIEVDPAAVVFTPLPVGKTSSVTLQVRNAGALPLHLQSTPAAVGANGSGTIANISLGSVLSNDCQGTTRASPLTFAPGECGQLTVIYAPANATAPLGYIDFLSDDPATPELKVPVSLGSPAQLKVCTLNADASVGTCDASDGTPPTLDFGTTAKNSTVTAKLRLTNAGTVGISNLSLAALSGDFSGPSSQAPTSLAAGVSVDLTFSFTPTASGTRTTTLLINSNDSTREPISVPFTGLGIGPAICASPSPLDFGSPGVGLTTAKTLTLTSCGTTAVMLQNVVLDPFSSPDFSAPQALPTAQSLVVGATLSINLALKPAATGSEAGTLDIFNDGDPHQYVLLTASAVQTPACHLSLSQNPLNFGPVVVGQSREHDASVTNAGTVDCHLTRASITAGSTWFSIANAPQASITLRPGDVYTVQATYAVPAGDNSSSNTGTLTWVSDDPINPSLNVALNGQPVAAPQCKLTVTPTANSIAGFSSRTLVFGNVVVGHNKTLPITFTNAGSANCNITGWKFLNALIIDPTGTCSATNCDDYTFGSPAPTSPLAPGQSTILNVQFAPTGTNQIPLLPTDYVQVQTSDGTVAANQECTLGLPQNNNVGCFQVGLSGQGDLSNLQVLPADLDFGLTTLGCSTMTATVKLYNTGTSAPIMINSIVLSPVVTPEPFKISYMPTPFSLAAGAETTIDVTYTPTQAAMETAQILISSDASNATSNNPYVTVALTGSGTGNKHQTDTFTQSALPQVDLLWVIDDSSSFEDYQTALSQQAPRFIANAQNSDGSWKADFHIGVIGNEVQMTDTADMYSAYQGDKIYVGGLFGHPSIIDNNTANAGTAFAKNIQIGTCCSDAKESDAEALWDALKPPTNMTLGPVGTEGFLRDSARLVMVVVTDEVDQSDNNTSFYVDFFKQLKGQYNAGLVSFNAITGDSGNGCMANGVSADANDFDIDIINGVGGKFWSLCTADWGTIADDLSLGAFQGRVQFPLSRVADPATIVVTMNGVAQTNPAQYHYDQPSNSIVFVTAPPANAVIVVDYDALCF